MAKKVFVKAISLIAAICTAISFIAIPASATGGNSSEKMLHLSATAGGWSVGNGGMRALGANVSLEADAEYSVYFKYSVASGVFDSSAYRTILFCDWVSGFEYRNHSTHVTGEYGFLKSSNESSGWNDITLTFKSMKTEIHTLGFGFVGAGEIYVADFEVKKADGTVIVKGVESLQDRVSGNDFVANELLDYDASMFTDTANKKMLHLKADTAGWNWNTGVRSVATRVPLNAGEKYTVYFKYKVVSGVFDGSDRRTVFFADWDANSSSNNQGRQHSTHEKIGSSGAFTTMTDGIDGWNDMELTFTAKTPYNNSDNVHSLGFTFVGAAEMYIGDFIVKDSSGCVLTSGFDSFKNQSPQSFAVNETLAYDASMFTDAANKQMLHLISNATGWGWNTQAQATAARVPLTQGKKYTIYFKYDVVNGVFDNSDSRTVFFADWSANGNAQNRKHSTHTMVGTSESFESVKDGIDGWNDIELTFTASDSNVHSLGFTFVGNTEMYVADLIIKDENGNMILNSFDGFGQESTKNMTQEKLSYDETRFTDEGCNKKMLHIGAQTGGWNWNKDMPALGVTASLTQDEEYSISFKYSATEGIFDTSDYRTMIFAVWQSTFQYRNYSSHDGSFTDLTIADGIASMKFKAKATQQHIIGFGFIGLGEIYITDFTLKDSNGNVLRDSIYCFTKNNDSVAALSTREIIAYDDSVFQKVIYDLNGDGTVNAADLAELRKYLLGVGTNGSDINNDGNIDILDLVHFKKLLSSLVSNAGDSYTQKQENMKAAVLNSASEYTVSANAKTYYFSADGSDDNDGLSENLPKQTLAALQSLSLGSGDAVLFKRGDIFRGNIVAREGVTYSAYGTGAKPVICGSVRNYADKKVWNQLTDTSGKKLPIWVYYPNGKYGSVINAGLVAFNHDFRTGKYDVKIGNHKTYQAGKDVRELLTNDLDFYSDLNSSTFYLYSETNPGERFNSIEIGEGNSVISGNADNVTIDNLHITLNGAHGVGMGNVNDLKVRNCVFDWIGGSAHIGQNARLGNAVQIYGSCNGFDVYNNWIYQIYDSGITGQFHNNSSADASKQSNTLANMKFHDNLIEYCYYGIEYFNLPGKEGTERKTENVSISNNYIRKGGYGFGSIGRNSESAALYEVSYNGETVTNFKTENNIFEDSMGYLISRSGAVGNSEISGNVNTFIQGFGSNFLRFNKVHYTYDFSAERVLKKMGETSFNNIYLS